MPRCGLGDAAPRRGAADDGEGERHWTLDFDKDDTQLADRDRLRGMHVGFVLQRLHLIGSLSVLDNLILARRLAGLPVARAESQALLAQLGLGDYAERMPATLSQGESQRVALARALAHRPTLVLADEPTAALDDANCAAAMQLMFEHAAAAGATLVVATHDARIRARFAQVVNLSGRPCASATI